MHTAVAGMVGGFAPLLAGWALRACDQWTLEYGWLELGEYSLVFSGALILMVGALAVMGAMPSDTKVTTAKFAGMFVTGNPLTAMQAAYSHSRGGALERRLMTAKRMGASRSPLVRDELLEALDDPSVLVRRQAIASVVDHRPDPTFTEKLVEIIRDEREDLSNMALFALARMRARGAVTDIRRLLDSKYPTTRGRAALALAQLGDEESAPRILELLLNDTMVRHDYGEALGILRYRPALVSLLHVIGEYKNEIMRQSLAFRVASIIGNETSFLTLLRSVRRDLADAQEEFAYHLRSRADELSEQPEEFVDRINESMAATQVEDRPRATAAMQAACDLMVRERLTEDAWTLIENALPLHGAGGTGCQEYGRLVVYAILAGGGGK